MYSLTNKKAETKGFTLIEILVVIGIIAVLAAIVIVAINPAKQFAQARNTQRESNVTTILNAIGQRIADNKGIFEGDFTVGGTTYDCPELDDAYGEEGISSDGDNTSDGDDDNADIDLQCLYPTYIPTQIPVDPSTGDWTDEDDYDTGYTVELDDTGRVTVCAPAAANEDAVPDAAEICRTR